MIQDSEAVPYEKLVFPISLAHADTQAEKKKKLLKQTGKFKKFHLSLEKRLTASRSLSMIASSSSKCLNFISSFFIWVSTNCATKDFIRLSSIDAKCWNFGRASN